MRAVSFDFWGTLYQNDVSLASLRAMVLEAWLSGSATPQPPSPAVCAAVDTAEKARSEAWHRSSRELGVSEWTRVALDSIGSGAGSQNRAMLEVRLREVVLGPSTRPVEGVAEALRELSGTLCLGIISNTGLSLGTELRRLLARDGLDDLFSLLVFSDEVQLSKPDPAIFKAFIAGLGIKPGELLHVGDTRETDVEGARLLGIRTVRFAGVRDDSGQPEADYVIHSYEDLPRIARSLMS